MSESSDEQARAHEDVGGESDDLEDIQTLRRQVEEKYDFDDFGPSDMREMDAREWEAAFDPGTWITGDALLNRVEAELKNRIARREVFAALERVEEDGQRRVLAYSDEGYALVSGDGTVRGSGTVLRDVKPAVALASMDEYEVSEPPENWGLPDPGDVDAGTNELGNWMLQVVAVLQLLAGLVLIVASAATGLETVVGLGIGLLFVAVAAFLFLTVANARLSDRFRAEEYRSRLAAVKRADGERPEFVPLPRDDEGGGNEDRSGSDGGGTAADRRQSPADE